MKALIVLAAMLALSIVVASTGLAEVTCTKFDVVLEIKDGTVVLRVESDLPHDTRVIIAVRRGYKERNNAGDYSLDYFSAINERLGAWRSAQEIPIHHNEWRQALQEKIDELF